MSHQHHFSLPYFGLKDGLHKYIFDADDSYFSLFESSPVKSGKLSIDLVLDKHPNVSSLEFLIDGFVNSCCDRCLADIQLPIHRQFTMHLKITSDDIDNDDEIIFLHPDSKLLDLSQVIYELIVLSLPMINVYNCQDEKIKPCNLEILKKFQESQGDEIIEHTDNSIWDNLKNLSLGDN